MREAPSAVLKDKNSSKSAKLQERVIEGDGPEEDAVPSGTIDSGVDTGTGLVTISETFSDGEAVGGVDTRNIVEVEVVNVLELGSLRT
jgi:hypothetical protein